MAALHFVIQGKATHPAVRADLCLHGAARERPGASGRHGIARVGEARQLPQSAMRAGQPALDGLAQVGQQMPPVGHLDRLGRADRDAAGVLRRAVAGDHLDPRPPSQPGSQCHCGAVGQQVDHAAPLQIDDDRAVAAPAALRPVINPDNTRVGLRRQRQLAEQAQHGVGAGRHGQPGQQPRTRLPPSAAPVRPCASASRRVRRAKGAISCDTRSAKVWRGHATLRQ